ncbi:MAG: NAD-dependent epimerase/dehydratase family protein [Nitrospirota bacterium]
MRILVTGGAGFIGSHLVDRLIQEGHEVSIVDDLSTGKKKNVSPKAEFYKLDILSPKVERVFKKARPEAIFHHAAQMDVRRSVKDPLFDGQVNILGTVNLLEQAVKVGTKRVIFASSGGAVYGEQEQFPAAEPHPTRPVSPYGISKLAGEHYLYYYGRTYGLQWTSLRYANVYGPRQDPFGEAGVVAIFTLKLLQNEQPVINGTGKQTRDYIAIDDVVEANMAVLNNRLTETFNVGTGRETTVNQLFRMLAEAVGSPIKERYGPERRGEQLRSCVDAGKLARAAEWEARTSLADGLKRTVEYFRQTLQPR